MKIYASGTNAVPKMENQQCQDYINFLIATQKAYSCTEAARVQPKPVAHDSILRILYQLEPASDGELEANCLLLCVQ